MRYALGWLLFLGLCQCGGALTHVSYEPTTTSGRSAFLVQVVDRVPSRPTRIVSYSVLTVDSEGAMPLRPSAQALASMRAMAASRGANFLLVERVDLPWRRAFFGTGLALVRGKSKPVARCRAPGTAARVSRVFGEIRACLAELKNARPALQARASFEVIVGALGRVKRALPQPGSSRDGAVQRCLLGPIFRAPYPVAPKGYVCSLRFAVDLR